MDFANKFIGGGSFNTGSVQEEILFLIYPELSVSVLICERMLDHEAYFIGNVKRFSDYTGYGKTLEFSKAYVDGGKKDIIAIDALCF